MPARKKSQNDGPARSRIRDLILVLGDQLNADSPAIRNMNPELDQIWMAEVLEESTHVPSSRIRSALFLAAMRHFAREITSIGLPITYHSLDDQVVFSSFAECLEKSIAQLRPHRCLMVRPGDWRVLQSISTTCSNAGVPLEILEDPTFLSTPDDFLDYAKGKKQIRQEFFYRRLRSQHGILMESDDQPMGGKWNFDASNRSSFPKSGPPARKAPVAFPPNELTRDVLKSVSHRFPDNPGNLNSFDWPVTRSQALEALDDFIQFRLPEFGQYQDAMWTHEPWLFHSRISASLNLKLLQPREVIQAATNALDNNQAPIEAVEGFIRQILGWREYVRGIYWWKMPEYLTLNSLQAHRQLPDFFWNGRTDMHCLNQVITQTFEFGYAHHIQRLMVTGLYSLLAQINPMAVHEWYLSVYVDAVEWVELPNTLGMALHADGGLMASKPYAASGKYIQRMSNYCQSCPFNPAKSTGPDACPFTTLYWNFLLTHRSTFSKNPRMSLQLKNLSRLSNQDARNIQNSAASILDN